jgi:elongator complex protein 4
VGERRTTPSANAIALDIGTSHAAATPAIATNPASGRDASTKDAALVQIALEGGVVDPDGPPTPARPRDVTTGVKTRKEKKKVAFRSDRPELYDF